MNWLGFQVQEHISNSDTVLDLGCGIMQASDDVVSKFILGVDIWDKYLDNIKHLHPTIRVSMEETDRFMDNSYDVVICLDVVEHLEKELALKILDECKRICRKKAIIYTPDKFHDNIDAVDNSWGLGKNEHQKHLCLIEKNDFRSLGYVVNRTSEGNLAVFNKC